MHNKCWMKIKFSVTSRHNHDLWKLLQIYFLGLLFWCAFMKLQQATISFVMSVCPSACPHGTTQLPLDRFSWTLIFQYFS
jgi:hypothetical protein